MTWASRKTAPMPTVTPSWSGRHRRRVRRLGAVVICLLALSVVGAAIAPALFDRRGAQAPSGGGSSTVIAQDRDSPSAPATPPAGQTASTHTTGEPTSTLPAESVETTRLEQELVTLTNAERTSNDCPALRVVASLRTAARQHSADMARRRSMSHTGHDGSDPAVRMRAAGYDPSRGWAENVARGFGTPRAVLSAWMNSSGHRANILNCGLRAIGVGAARATDGDLYWTQDFGGW